MEARSRKLDARAKLDAELDLGINQNDEDAMDEDEEEGADGDLVTFDLPTAAEREEEKKRGGPDVHTVQRRMRECVRVLGNFRRYAAKGRYVFCYHNLSVLC